MSIHLYFSNQLYPLAQHLHVHLTMDADSGPILSPPLVIVPTMNLSKWVKLFLARHSGIFMNVRFSYLEDGLWQMLRLLFPDFLKVARPMDPSRFRLILFFILMGQVSEPDMPEAIRRYLVRSKEGKAREEESGEEKTGADELRAWQLAGTLARLFQEYEYHRMDMIHRWRQTDDAAGDPVEDGQKWLYRKALDLSGAFGRISEAPRFTLAEYADLLPEKLSALAFGHPFSSVHIFGLSQISPLHVHLLARLGKVFDFHVYSLNPSREYWEDIQTPAEKEWRRRNGAHTLSTNADEWEAGELFSETGHPLLSAWGKTGRESIRLLCELTGYDFYAGFDDPPKPDTVLAAVRYSLLTLSPSGDGLSPLAQDTSLQIFAAPGIRREVETVYQSILHHLETDPDLAMTDIAVMVSDMARYKPMVDAVFGQRPAQIRYNLVDARAVAESAVARAILAFIPIAGGDFSRKAVFDLLHNPCVMKKWRYTPEDLGVWVNWADELGIFHDFENPETSPETSMDRAGPQAGRYSWKQGLQRLRLSRIMTSPMDVLFGDPAPHFNGLVPFADIHTPNDALLETFCAVVTELFRQGSAFRMASASAKTWKTLFFRVVDAFVEIPEDMPGEEAVYQSLVEAFSVLEDYDTLMAASPGRPLTQAAVWTFVRSHLDGISGGQGDYLTGGVTISAMMPMRPIPFKIVYVLGLEEGRFPAKHPDSPLDLRNRKRRIGDVSPGDRDRYLFLEILISVQSRLYLSYVSRDLQKDRELSPCQVVHQLRRYVETFILGNTPFSVCHIPLRPDSAAYFLPDAVTSRSDIMARTADIHRLSGLRRCGGWPVFENRATVAEKKRVHGYGPDFDLPAQPEPGQPDKTGPEDPLMVSIDLLYRFLLDPVQSIASRYLEIEDRPDAEDRLAEQSDEPFSTIFPADYHLRSLPLHRWLSAKVNTDAEDVSLDALEDRFDALYADFYRRSRTPGGAFARRDDERLKTVVMETGTRLAPFVEAIKRSRQWFFRVEMGDATGGDTMAGTGKQMVLPEAVIPLTDAEDDDRFPKAKAMPPLPKSVCLTGGLSWVWQEDDLSWHSLILGRARKKRVPDKSVISPILSLMALCAGSVPVPWAQDHRMTLHVVFPDGVQTYPVDLDPVFAGRYLKHLIGAFLTPFPLLWLPFGLITTNSSLKKKIISDTVTDADREAFRRLLAQENTDLLTSMAGAMISNDSLDHARSRFRIFFPDVDAGEGDDKSI